MIDIFSLLIAVLLMAPIMVLMLIFIISKTVLHQPKKSLHLSIDLSTILFIFSVHFLILAIWDKSLFWLIVLFILIMMIIFTLIHWKLQQDIKIRKIIKGVWRLQFLVFFTLYIILTFYGMAHRVFANLTI